MWQEEDHNYFDLEPILWNYGIKAENKFGYGIKDALVYGKDFKVEFYLSEEELNRMHDKGYEFLMSEKNFKYLLKEIKTSKKELLERIESWKKLDLAKLTNKELYDLYDFYVFKLVNIFICYSMTQPHRVTK